MAEIPLAARKFDELPDSAHVDARTVSIISGRSVPTVWRHAANGALPKPEPRPPGTNIARWNVGKLRRALGLERPANAV